MVNENIVGVMNTGTFQFQFLPYLSGIWLLTIMILAPLNWNVVFDDIETTSFVEIFMLFGLLLVILFDIAVVIWFITRYTLRLPPFRNQFHVLIGAVFCLFFLASAKVMADEVGRESRLGLVATGEFIILNILFGVQLGYNVFFVFVTRGKRMEHGV